MDIFSDAVRRDPYPLYDQLRGRAPAFRVPPPFDAWMLFDYESVKRVLSDHETISSQVPAPKHWFLFTDPPNHTKLRGLIAQAFTPRMIANLEPLIVYLSRQLLDEVIERGEMDLVADYAVPLPMQVLAAVAGIPQSEWPTYKRWSDTILKLSYTRSGGPEADQSLADYMGVHAEMGTWLEDAMRERGAKGGDDLLTRLMDAEVNGERLSPDEILGFLELLIVAGQETTSDLISNAVLSLLEHPDQLSLLRNQPNLLPTAIEEVLRFRSPLQWTMRTPRVNVVIHGRTIEPGKLVLAVMGSANRDPRQFANPDHFDIRRSPNPHVAFGHGVHFCLGASLSRLEAKVALPDLLTRLHHLERADCGAWEPRKALHVFGPDRLPVRFDASKSGSAS
jgi:cytochrome P450